MGYLSRTLSAGSGTPHCIIRTVYHLQTAEWVLSAILPGLFRMQCSADMGLVPLRLSLSPGYAKGPGCPRGFLLTLSSSLLPLRAPSIVSFSYLLLSQKCFYLLLRWVLTPEFSLPLDFENFRLSWPSLALKGNCKVMEFILNIWISRLSQSLCSFLFLRPPSLPSFFYRLKLPHL